MTESNPAFPVTSAMTALGAESQPLTAPRPSFQVSRSLVFKAVLLGESASASEPTKGGATYWGRGKSVKPGSRVLGRGMMKVPPPVPVDGGERARRTGPTSLHHPRDANDGTPIPHQARAMALSRVTTASNVPSMVHNGGGDEFGDARIELRRRVGQLLSPTTP